MLGVSTMMSAFAEDTLTSSHERYAEAHLLQLH